MIADSVQGSEFQTWEHYLLKIKFRAIPHSRVLASYSFQLFYMGIE